MANRVQTRLRRQRETASGGRRKGVPSGRMPMGDLHSWEPVVLMLVGPTAGKAGGATLSWLGAPVDDRRRSG